jgi:short-subunit dehydrogenase
VNNAGFGTHGRFDQIDFAREMDMLQVNVVALSALTKLFVDEMIQRRRGWILNVSSTAAFQAGPLMAVYFASKAYVQSFSEALAVELKEFGIHVTALCPGPTPTGFQKRAGFGETNILRSRKRDVAKVARAGYDAVMAGKLLVVPGLQNKLLADATRFAPRRWAAQVAKKFNE